jgi:hypothetical protein
MDEVKRRRERKREKRKKRKKGKRFPIFEVELKIRID